MANSVSDYRTLCAPVNPLELWTRLSEALALKGVDVSAQTVTSLPMPDVDSESFRDEYLLKELLRKYPDFDLGIDTREASLSTFWEDELANTFTNDRLLTYNLDNPGVEQIIESASRKIGVVLGRFDWEEFFEGVRFGPGATIRHTRLEASVWGKLSGVPYVSRSAHWLLQEIVSRCPGWAYSLYAGDGDVPVSVPLDFVTCEYDRGTCVTKNAKTDRFIGIGPDGNVAAQLGAGYSMRKRLARVGINLNDQTINQRLAHEGSVDGEIATVDVRSASQSVTWGLVYKTLGSRPAHEVDRTWFMVLDALRTRFVLLDGRLHEYALFSAMGNGFTFELESLLFWGLAMATCEFLAIPTEKVSVYGDDITIPSKAVPMLREVFAWCGFRLNMDKSFWSLGGENHRFRESCGKHYRDGVDVSPFYCDKGLDTPDQIVLLANNLLRWSRLPFGRDARVKGVWEWVISHLHPLIRECQIPFGEQNDGLILDWDECRSVRPYLLKAEGGHLPTSVGWCVRTFVVESRQRQNDDGRTGLSTWFYNRAVNRHSIAVPTWWEKLVREIVAPESLDPELSLRFKERCVSCFTPLGPWVQGIDAGVPESTDLWMGVTARTRAWIQGQRKTFPKYQRSTKPHPVCESSRDYWQRTVLEILLPYWWVLGL